MTIRIRPAAPADTAALAAILNPYILETHVHFGAEPVGATDSTEWLAAHPGGRHCILVAADDGRVVGFASSSRWRERAAYETTVETSVYCARGSTGRGIGTALYRELFSLLESEDVHRAVAGITLPNDASIALHERFGFARVGVFAEVGRKLDRFWDVAWYLKPLR